MTPPPHRGLIFPSGPYVLPHIELPFPSRSGPYADTLAEDVLRWATGFSLLPDRRSRDSFSRADLGEVASRSYATDDFDRAVLMTRWIGWTAYTERTFDVCQTQAVAGALGFLRSYLEHGPPVVPDPASPVACALADLWEKTTEHMPAFYLRRLAKDILDYLDACAVEIQDRQSPVLPTVREYVEQRMLTVAGYVYCDLVELCVGHAVPEALSETEGFRELRVLWNHMISMVNDIYSAPKEIAERDHHNLVLLLCLWNSCSFQEAVAIVERQLADRAADFLRVAGRFPEAATTLGFSEAELERLRRYTGALGAFVAGERDWHEIAARYTDHYSLNG